MYRYTWDEETGGLLLTSEVAHFSKEPRPVYFRELELLGLGRCWNYPKDDTAPIMWAETNNYFYRGRHVATTNGGALYSPPELIIYDEPEPNGGMLRPVDVPAMLRKNTKTMEILTQETVQKIYNTYKDYRKKVDLFYVAFSGGKDSVVVLDLVQRALPHDDFIVLFGDTGMEFPDTYDVVNQIESWCEENKIQFARAKSRLEPDFTWSCFGPPSTNNRWCCSVHKTAPQINLLREIVGKRNFTGMAFTGIRADESLARSTYDIVSDGRKHSGQLSCHAILNWNSAELFCYIFAQNLILNEAYKNGNQRAGCLVCPNSARKNEYIKRSVYHKEVDFFLEKIASTSGKTNYSKSQMKEFINNGFWRTRKTGRELNFGQDKFEVISGSNPPTIVVYVDHFEWRHWGKTIGALERVTENLYEIQFEGKIYAIKVLFDENKTTFILANCENTKSDVKFQSLIRSVIIKSLYCVACGECEAECKYGCLDMKNGLLIKDNCVHCHRCHEVQGRCLRYASIRNKISGEEKMVGLDRYYSFGVREEWLDIFVRYNGGKEFWLSDGDGKVANKKKDAFKNFVDDAELVKFDKAAEGDKFTKRLPTPFFDVIAKLGASSQISWALILSNLAYTPAFNWFIHQLQIGKSYTPASLKLMLKEVMENDTNGIGNKNVNCALRIMMAKTPLGREKIFANCDIEEKILSSGAENIKMNSITRVPWDHPDDRVILYGLYKFAEKCGDYYQFSLSSLLDDSIERGGVSPTRVFGLDRDAMIPILNGLSINYPEFISASFTLGLETVNLRPEKSSADVLDLF